MESLPDCIARLRRENGTFAEWIQRTQQPGADALSKMLVPYYEGLIRTNTEVIAILERYQKENPHLK